MKKFLVVLFPLENDDIDVISSSWILPPLHPEQKCEEKLCRYPSKVRGTNLAKLVVGHQPPSGDWLILQCRVLGEFDDYLEARGASITAVDTSNIESTKIDEEDGRRLRRRKQIQYKKVIPPPPPRVLRQENPQSSSDESNTLDDNIPNNSHVQFNLVAVGDLTLEGNSIDETRSERPDHSHAQFNLVAVDNLALEGNSIEETGNERPDQAQDIGNNILFELQEVQNNPDFSGIVKILKDIHVENRKFQDIVIGKLVLINNKLASFKNPGSSSRKDVALVGAPPLPLTCKEDLDKLNNWITGDKNQDLLVEFLSLCGGNNVAAVTSSILKEICTNEFAKEVSFTGQGSKAVCGIKDSPVHKTIIKAVRANNGFDKATDLEIRQATINWFRNAGDRAGGREVRRRIVSA